MLNKTMIIQQQEGYSTVYITKLFFYLWMPFN